MTAQTPERANDLAIASASDPVRGAGTGPAPITVAGGATGVPAIGAWATDDHRYYFNGEGWLPSVTTVLKVIDKPAISTSRAMKVARAAWRQLYGEPLPWLELPAPVNALHPDRDPAAERYALAMLKVADADRDRAATLGSSVHTLADMAARAHQPAATAFGLTPEQFTYASAFDDFLARLVATGHARIVSSEHAIFNLAERFAGRFDLLLELRDPLTGARELWLVDIKTGVKAYADYAIQLAGYDLAEFIGLEGDPTRYPWPRVQRYGVLHLRPDAYPPTPPAGAPKLLQGSGWRLIEFSVTDRERMAFLAAAELWRWQRERSREVVRPM